MSSEAGMTEAGSPRPADGRRGLLFVVSAPSGTGKTTVVERLVQTRARSGDVALLHVASGKGRGDATVSTIISLPAPVSKR